MALVVFTMTTAAAQPGQGTLHYPSFGKENEPLGFWRTPYHLETPAARCFGVDPLLETMVVILVVSPYHVEAL
jgi:hypothetical protein